MSEFRTKMHLKASDLTSLIVLTLIILGSFEAAISCDASEMRELLGYTVLAVTRVNGEFEGADFDKPVALQNGMIFTFNQYRYSYSYAPEVVVFATTLSEEEAKKINPRLTGPFVLYKLMIRDHIYNVSRVR